MTDGVLLYDPDCGFCTATARRMQGWGLGCLIEPMTPARLAQLGVDERRALREVPFVGADTQVRFGAEAFAAALRTGNLTHRVAGRLLATPPVSWLGAVVYREVAGHRHQLPGGTDACELR